MYADLALELDMAKYIADRRPIKKKALKSCLKRELIENLKRYIPKA